MIVHSRNFVLNVQDAVEAADLELNNPIIGYHNIITADNLTVTGEDVDYPATNLLNESTNLVWRADTAGEHFIEVTTNSADSYDYVAVARHNFGSANIMVSVELYDSSWSEVVEEHSPADDAPLILRYPVQGSSGIRLRMQEGDAPPQIGVIYVGKLLVLQRRLYVGHGPLPLNKEYEFYNGRSENGEFLGRVLVSERASTTVNLQNLTPQWARNKLRPFIEDSAERPFFFAWRPSKYPDEVGFCWMTNSPKLVNQRPNGMMQVQLELGGIVS